MRQLYHSVSLFSREASSIERKKKYLDQSALKKGDKDEDKQKNSNSCGSIVGSAAASPGLVKSVSFGVIA